MAARLCPQRIEKYSIVKAIDAIERADVVILMIDAREGVTDQDQKIAALARDRGCAMMMLVNKWDLIENKTDATATKKIKELREKLVFCQDIPIFTISALSGQRTHRILDTAKRLYLNASVRISTGELNRVFARILQHHSAPMVGSRTLKFYFVQHVTVRPPTFVIQCNIPRKVPADYKRYLLNQLRGYYGFVGSPIRMIYRQPSSRHSWRNRP